MGANLIGELVANNGTYFLPSGSEIKINVDQVIVRGSTINELKLFITVDGLFVEVTTDYVGDSRLPNGLRITPKGDDVFTKIVCGASNVPHEGFELVLA